MNEKLYQNIVQSLIHAAEDVFKTMIFMEIKAQEPFERKGLESLSDITGVISQTGDIMGSVILSMEGFTSQKVVSSMLGDQIENPHEVVDGIGEICNMVVGMAKTEMSNYSCDFEISVPVMITGKGARIQHISEDNQGLTTIPLVLEDGAIVHLELYIKDSR